MSLYCLVYTSFACQKISDDDLQDLISKTRKKNETRDVTGVLLFLDPFFMQVLEGEETMVNDLFNLIKQDPRHDKVSLIYRKLI
jgi:hypothetical protein